MPEASDKPLTASEQLYLEGLRSVARHSPDVKAAAAATAEVEKLRAKSPSGYKYDQRRQVLSELPPKFAVDRAKLWELQDAGLDDFDTTQEMLHHFLTDESHPSHRTFRRQARAAAAQAQRQRKEISAQAEHHARSAEIDGVVDEVVQAAKRALVDEVVEAVGSMLHQGKP